PAPRCASCGLFVLEGTTLTQARGKIRRAGLVPSVPLSATCRATGPAISSRVRQRSGSLGSGGSSMSDRRHWENRGGPEWLGMVDELLRIIRGLPSKGASALEPNYTPKDYIGVQERGRPNTWVSFHCTRGELLMKLRCRESPDAEKEFDAHGLRLHP